MTPGRPLVAMCIDDAAIDLRLNARVLRATGLYEPILTFVSGEDALDHFRGHPDRPVDVIFLDVNMPRMTGFEFLEAAMAEFGPDVAGAVVIMLTTSLHPRDRAQAGRFDIIREYLPKPLTEETAVRIAGLLGAPGGH
jgi:CheY-like chemotaxis protein